MNVVYIGRYNDTEILSGPEKAAKRIFNEHIKHCEGTFIQYFFDGRQYGLIKKLFGKDVKNVNNSKVYTLGLFRIVPTLIKLRPRIIHFINYERFGVTALKYKIFSKAKFIYNAHGIIAFGNDKMKTVSFFYRLKDKICEKQYFRFSNKIVFMSGESIELAENYYKINNDKCFIIANGIDKQFSSVVPKNNGTLKAVYIAGAELHESGMSFLKSVIPAIKNNLELYIIGNIIDSAMDKLNKNVKIHFVNKMNTDELAAFYQDKDIFLSLNKYDTFSISSVEAMAAGLITIVTQNTGMSRYITTGENGYTIKYGEIHELCDIIDSLNLNPALRIRVSSESRKIYEILSWENVYETYKNIYAVLLK